MNCSLVLNPLRRISSLLTRMVRCQGFSIYHTSFFFSARRPPRAGPPRRHLHLVLLYRQQGRSASRLVVCPSHIIQRTVRNQLLLCTQEQERRDRNEWRALSLFHLLLINLQPYKWPPIYRRRPYKTSNFCFFLPYKTSSFCFIWFTHITLYVSQHSPLGESRYVYASIKTHPKNPVEKKVGEKSTSHALLILHLLPR
jgi:hypothetical protein